MIRSVLLVDDTAFLRAMLRAILESSGRYRVAAEASDGAAALALVPELSPDIVVTDLIMPGLDGIELTRALAGADPSLRILVTAAADQEGAVRRALAAGARDFIPKPYSAPELLRILEDLPLPDGRGECESRIHVELSLAPATTLPRTRWEVLRSRIRRLGAIVEEEEPDPAVPEEEIPLRRLVLTSAHPAEIVSRWIGALPGVARVGAIPAPAAPEPTAASAMPRPATLPGGTLRVRAALLERLLRDLERIESHRDDLARDLSPRPEHDVPLARAALDRIDERLRTMKTEVLSARLVPFHRIAARLERDIERGSGPARASLRLIGSETRFDLGLLEELGSLLALLIERILLLLAKSRPTASEEAGPEVILELAISRSGSRGFITLALPADWADSPDPLIDDRIRERARFLEGTIGISRTRPGPRLEIMFPAGVEVVRSYLCQVGKHLLAVPVSSVEQAVEVDPSRIRLREGKSFWQGESGEPVPLVRPPRARWVEADGPSLPAFPGLIYRVGPLRFALAVDALLGKTDLVIRGAPGETGAGEVTGIALMPDGTVAWVPDLPRLARAR